jgi:hypothetical protein
VRRSTHVSSAAPDSDSDFRFQARACRVG